MTAGERSRMQRPDLVLRIAFAGDRILPVGVEPLRRALEGLLPLIARRVLWHRDPGTSPIAPYYSDARPCLRFITGLAEGADAVLADSLQHFPVAEVRTELAAVLPSAAAVYRASQDASFQPTFDAALARCSYIVQGDGQNPTVTHDAKDAFARRSRDRALRLQSQLLLRQADLLLATFDPDQEERAGGTVESVREALGLGMAVVAINCLTGRIVVLEAGDRPPSDWTSLEGPAPDGEDPAHEKVHLLERAVDRIVAGMDQAPQSGAHGEQAVSPAGHLQVLQEFFEGAPLSRLGALSIGVYGWVWKTFARVVAGVASRELERPQEPASVFRQWRDRARALNYACSNLYRGAFVLNYLLAVAAVSLAAGSLALMAWHGEEGCHLTLLLAAFVKLAILLLLFALTVVGNKNGWAARAIDFRFLAERLRAMLYLPGFGCLQPIRASRPRSAAREMRQTAIDWLFGALVRAHSPAEHANGSVPAPDGRPIPAINIDAGLALARLRDSWLGSEPHEERGGSGQIGYHLRNWQGMSHMQEGLEKLARRLSLAVIIAVLADIGLHWAPEDMSSYLHPAGLILLLLAAVLPAAIASLNGIRFQSECQRLADRSSVMAHRLREQRREVDEALAEIQRRVGRQGLDLGSWGLEALQVADSVTRDTLEDVTEWSVLYNKDIPEA
jgi:hypothetical protein